MTYEDDKKITMVSCGVLKAEIQTLREQYWPNLEVNFLSSMLHMKPEKLAASLESQLSDDFLKTHKYLLIYGDCCSSISNLSQRTEVVRTRCNNCIDLLLGREQYRRLSHEGAFFLLPEWMYRWESIFRSELGLDETNAKSMMGDLHTKLVLLDTGLAPVPSQKMDACAKYCGLPWESLPVSLDLLRNEIQFALNELTTAEVIDE